MEDQETSRVGVGGVREFVFQALENGRANLELLSQRSWEPEDEYADSFILSIIITDQFVKR